MKDKSRWISITAQCLALAAVFTVIYILIQYGLKDALTFIKDCIVNILIAIFSIYLLIAERKLKAKQQAVESCRQHEERLNKSGMATAQLLQDAMQKSTRAGKELRSAEDRHQTTVLLLAVITIAAAIVSITAYLTDLPHK